MPMKNKWNMARKFSQLSHKFNLSEDVAVCCSMAKFNLAFVSMPGLSSMSTRQFAWMSPSKWPHAWWLDNAPPLSFLRNEPLERQEPKSKNDSNHAGTEKPNVPYDKSVLAGAPPAFGAAPPATGAATPLPTLPITESGAYLPITSGGWILNFWNKCSSSAAQSKTHH